MSDRILNKNNFFLDNAKFYTELNEGHNIISSLFSTKDNQNHLPILASLQQSTAPAFGSALDITALSAAQLGRMLDSGTITSREIVLQYMYRIQRYDHAGPSLRAVAQINPDILKIADAADAQRAAAKINGIALPPLFGVPALVKLNIDTNDGLGTNAGSVALIGSRPDADATVIGGLRDYGVIILGKTNMGEWAGFISNDRSSIGGQMLNPYDPNVTVAGSSGGSSIAVNMHFAPMTIGTQTSDSIMYPAQQQGIYALKPTEGLVSITGIAPYSTHIDAAGPMTNSVRDLALMLNGMVKQDQTDNRAADYTRPTDYSAGLTGDLAGVTVGVYNATSSEAPNRSPLFGSTVTALLTEAHATVVQLDRVSIDAAVKAALTVLSDEDLAIFATGAGSQVPIDPAGRAAFLDNYRSNFDAGADALVRLANSAPIFADAAHSIASYLAQRVSSPQDYQNAFVRLFGDRLTRLDESNPNAYVKSLEDLVKFAGLNPDIEPENIFKYLQELANDSNYSEVSALYKDIIRVTTSVMAGTRAVLGINAAIGLIGDDDNENDGHIAFTFLTDQLSGSPELAVPLQIGGVATSLVINADSYQEATLLKIGDALQKQLATSTFSQFQIAPPNPPESGFVDQPIDEGPLLPLVLNDLNDHGHAIPAHLLSTAMAPLILNATGTVANLVFDGAISGSGGLIKDGAGLQSLTGTSDFTGTVDVWSGTLAIDSTAALGASSNIVVLEDGSALVATRSLTLGRNVLLKNGGALGAQAGATFLEDGNISGTGGLTKNGVDQLILSGANTYTGGTVIQAGKLSVAADQNLGDASGAVRFATGASLEVTANFQTERPFYFDGDGILEIELGKTLTTNKDFAGLGSLTLNGAGRLIMNCAQGNYASDTYLNNGTLELGQIDAAGTGAITFGNGAQTLQLDTAGALANRITGFGLGDTIKLTALSGSEARMSYAGGILSVTDGFQTTSCAIAAPAIGYSFALGTDANGGAALSLAPTWVNEQLTITPANQNALGDIVFTTGRDTLYVDSTALQNEIAQDGSFFSRLPNHLVNFGHGDKIIIQGTNPIGTSWNFDPASGSLKIHQVVSGLASPDRVLTFDHPMSSVFGTGIFDFSDDGIAIRLSALPPGDPNFGSVGHVVATRHDPTGWAAKAASWESPEFLANWGNSSVKAQFAYALGITGTGVKIGMVDSGLYKSHQEFKDNPNIILVDATGDYTSSGRRYESGDTRLPNSMYNAGDAFNLPGAFDPTYNDLHGTAVGGIIAAARNGTGMHGIAFGATLYAANSGGTDGIEYGANTDYGYYRAAYSAVAARGARAINTSWGGPDGQDDYDTLAGATAAYARSYGHPTHLDAIAEIALNNDVIQVFAGGNQGRNNLNINSSLAYFRPALERHWISVTGYDAYDKQLYNKAGFEKYWTISAPGQDLTTTAVGGPEGLSVYADPTDPNPYINWGSGTSDAAPHVTGALALVMQRFVYMGNDEARDVLLTTAKHHDAVAEMPDIHPDAPNSVWGWGQVDIKTAMDGPGQFLGAFTVDMAAGVSDGWLNAIGEGALIQRQAEDADEQAGWRATLRARGWDAAPPTAQSSIDDQVAYSIGTGRATAAAARDYHGSLIKNGEGTLTLGGAHSTYSGGTFLNGGTLELAAVDAAGKGAITFGAGAQTLKVDTSGYIANQIVGFGLGDVIDVEAIRFSQASLSYAGGILTVSDGTRATSVAIAPAAKGYDFRIGADADGSTTVTMRDLPPIITLGELPSALIGATSAAGAAVSFSGVALDGVDGTDPLVFREDHTEVRSGDVFGLGRHVVVASATDSTGNSADPVSFSFTVADIKWPVLPVTARSDSLATTTHIVGSGNVLANDFASDVDDTLVVSAVQFANGLSYAVPDTGVTSVAGQCGTLIIGADGHYNYVTSNVGIDAFTYTVDDGRGGSASTSLSIKVAGGLPAASHTFDFAFLASRVADLNAKTILTGPDGVPHDVTGVGQVRFTDGVINEADSAPLVSDMFYNAHNPDVFRAGVDPDEHYAQFGWKEGRDPNALFSTKGYLIANPDVAAAGVNPLQHYEQHGRHEGRSPSPSFSAEAYLALYPDVRTSGMDPLTHYLQFGQTEGRSIADGKTVSADGDHFYGAFDATFYLAANPDVAAAIPTDVAADSFAFTHYLVYGAREGRDPNTLFSTEGYLKAYPDVAAAGVNPILHYEIHGWQEGLDVPNRFDTVGYLAANPDVAAAHVDPLEHYLQIGSSEGRHGWEI